ncbi:MAG: hypothetical protein JWQ21_2191 [Herminiimonas sp.]|nr:hypothetical protein [Herminiimonas sp.]
MIKFIIAIMFCSVSLSVQALEIGNIFGALAGRSGSMGHDRSIDEALVKVSTQMNRKMPMIIDQDTRLDRVSAEPGHHFTYHYTLLSMRSKDVNTADFQKMIRPQLKRKLCESIEMQNFLKSGVTVSYLYKDSDGHAIGGVEFAPSECGYKS